MTEPIDWGAEEYLSVDALMECSKGVLAATVRAQAAQIKVLWRDMALLELELAHARQSDEESDE